MIKATIGILVIIGGAIAWTGWLIVFKISCIPKFSNHECGSTIAGGRDF
jgi:hypothetical protein